MEPLFTQAQLVLGIARLRDQKRIWIVNDWIINVDGTFVPQVCATVVSNGAVALVANAAVPDFPTVQGVCNLADFAVASMVMAATTRSPEHSPRNDFGKLSDGRYGYATLTLHRCETRIASFSIEVVFPAKTAYVARRPYEVLECAVLAENKTLRKKYAALLECGRVTCIGGAIVNIDGVYVPQVKACLNESRDATLPVAQLPTYEDVVEKGVHSVVAAMIMEAPATATPWIHRSRNGMLFGKNVQTHIVEGTGAFTPNARFTSNGLIIFDRIVGSAAAPAPAPAPDRRMRRAQLAPIAIR